MSKGKNDSSVQGLGLSSIIYEKADLIVSTLSCDDWCVVRDYPYQTNNYIERRLARGGFWKDVVKGNRELARDMSVVKAALLEERLYKLDGHVRAALWTKGALKKPERLLVVIYRAATEKEMRELFNSVHHGARENYDAVMVAYANAGLAPQSQRFKRGFIVEALNIALRGAPRALQDKRVYRNEIDIEEAVGWFKHEIQLIDGINPSVDVFVTGVVAAGLLSLSVNPERIGFFMRLAEKKGNIRDGKRDPVESVLRFLDIVRQKKARQAQVQADLCARTVRAVIAWDAGSDDPSYWTKYSIQSIDLMPLIREVKQIKKRVKQE